MSTRGSYYASFRKASAVACGVAPSTSTASEPVPCQITMTTGMNSPASSAAHSANKVDAELLPFVRCSCVISMSENASPITL